MRDLPALIVAVILGGFVLLGLLWLWFWFDDATDRGRSAYYPRQDRYIYKRLDVYDSRSRRYRDRPADDDYYDDDNEPVYSRPHRPRRHVGRRPCHDPCYTTEWRPRAAVCCWFR